MNNAPHDRSTPPRSRDEIKTWLVSGLSERFEIEASALDLHLSADELGMDSMQAAELTFELEDWLGKPVPATLFLVHPTLDSVISALAELAAPPPRGP